MYETYNSTTFSENDKEANKVDEKYNINNKQNYSNRI